MLIGYLRRFFQEYKEPRFRDRRAFYASQALACPRNLFWQLTGEKETDPPDVKGKVRMLIGKAVERELVSAVISQLHFFGLHQYGGAGSQIPVGFTEQVKGADGKVSSVAVDGYLDGLLVERTGDKFSKPIVLEVKVKFGYGANEFAKDCNPGPEYLAQLGLYLRELTAKGVTSEGSFLFCLVSDADQEFCEVSCRYDKDEDEVVAFKAEFLGSGETLNIDYRLKLGEVVEGLAKVQEAVAKGECPAPKYKYKHELTPDFVSSLSDYTLEKALNGAKILGDWQFRYSPYFTKALQVDRETREYTPEQLAILQAEWQQRKPRSKKFQKAG